MQVTREIGIKMAVDSTAVAVGTGQARRDFERMGNTISQVSEKSGRDVTSAATTLKSAFAGYLSLQTVKHFFELADAATNVESKLRLVTGTTRQLATAQTTLFEIAQASRVSYTELSATYAQMARSTKDLGLTQTALMGVTRTISQAMTISGGSAQSMNAALVQLTQGMASGTLRGEELNSIMEQTPRLAQAIASGMGKSVGELRALGEAGQLTAEKVIGALEKSAAAVDAEFQKMTPTVEQALTRINNSLVLMVGNLDKVSGVSGTVSGWLTSLSRGMDVVSDSIGKLASQAGLRDAAQDVLALDRRATILRNGLANGFYGPQFQRELDTVNAKLEVAKQRFRDLNLEASRGANAGSDSYLNFKPRSQSYADDAARTAKDLESLNNLRLKLAKVPDGYIKDMQEIIRLNQAGVLVGDAYNKMLAAQQKVLLEKTAVTDVAGIHAINAQIERLKQKAELEEVLGKRASEQLQARLQLGLVSEREYIDQVAAVELQGLAKNREILTQKLALQSKIKDTAKEQATLSGEIAELDEKRLSRELTLKNALLVLDEKRRRESELLHQASLNQAQQSVTAIEEQNRATALEIETIGLTEEAMHRLTNARLDEILARQQERIAVLQSFDLAGQSQDLIDIEIRKLDALKEARSLNDRKYGVEQIQRINEAWLTLKNDVYQGLTDSLYRGFEAGKGFFSAFWDGIKNTFKTTVLKVGVQGVMTGVSGALGIGGSTSTGTGASGSLGSIANLFQTGSSVYSALTTGFAGALGSAVSTVFGGVAGNAAIAASLTGSASSAVAAASAASIAGGGTAAGATLGAGIGSTIGAALPYVGVALAAYSLLSGKGETRMGGQYDTTNGLLAAPSGGEIAGNAVQQTITATVSGINDLFKTLGSSASVSYYNAGLESSKNGKGFTYAGGTLADGTQFGNGFGTGYLNNRGSKTAEEALAQFEVERQQSIILALQAAAAQAATDIPATIRDMIKGVDANALDAAGVKALLDQIGAVVTSVKQFGAVIAGLPFENLENLGFDATASLIALAGGMDTLGSSISSYYSNFYTADEQAAQTVSNLTASLAAMGYSLPTTRDGFRDLVNAQDLSTEAGRNTYVALLGISDAFASITPAAESAATSLAALRKSALDLATTTASDAYSALEHSVAAQRQSAELAVSVATEQVNTIRSVFDVLKSNVQGLTGQVDSTVASQGAQGQQFILQALATAKATGYLPDSTALTDAINGARAGIDNTAYSSQFEADYARLSLAGTLAQLQEASGDQLTSAEKTLALAQDQVDALDSMLTFAKQQLDAANGIDVSVRSIAEALDLFNAGVLALIRERASQGLSTGGVPAFEGGGYHAGGVRLVGENGPELEVTGAARIWSASQTRDMLTGNGGGGNNALAAEVRALREDQRAQALALVQAQARMAKILERWDGAGLPEEREVMQ